MLEAAGVLRTWRLLTEPGAGRVIRAEPLGDHRMVYLDYEGPVSGERGTVARWDSGTFDWVCDTEREVVVEVAGRRLRGRVIVEQSFTGWTWRLSDSSS